MLKLKTCNKIKANTVEVDGVLVRPEIINKSIENVVGTGASVDLHIEEPTLKTPKAYSNLISNLQPLTSKTGITLIALIITIIIMLILVGVTISVTLNGGLFEKARTATQQTQEKLEQEQLIEAAVAAFDPDTGVDFDSMIVPSVFKVEDGKYISKKSGKKYTINKQTAEVKEIEPEAEKIITEKDKEYNYWKTDGNGTIVYYEPSDGENAPETLIVPCQIGNEKITKIGDFALCAARINRNDDGTIKIVDDEPDIVDSFEAYGPTSVTGVTSNVKKIVISKGINEIGVGALAFCINLNEISIPEGVTKINESAFAYCRSIKNIKLPEGLIEICTCAFQECSLLEEINLPDTLTTIGQYAFDKCNYIKEITIPSSVDNIGIDAFGYWEATQKIYIKGKTEPPALTDSYSGSGWERGWDKDCEADIIWDTNI